MSQREKFLVPTAIGKILKNHRESLGMTIDQVSNNLKIKAKDIKSLEQGSMNFLASPYYAIGFIRSYGRLLKLDDSIINSEVKLLMIEAGLDNTRHGSVNFDYLDIKAPSKELFYKSLLVIAILYLIFIIFYQFNHHDFITTEAIISELNKIEE